MVKTLERIITGAELLNNHTLSCSGLNQAICTSFYSELQLKSACKLSSLVVFPHVEKGIRHTQELVSVA